MTGSELVSPTGQPDTAASSATFNSIGIRQGLFSSTRFLAAVERNAKRTPDASADRNACAT
jgi:hypothetical protein